MKKVLIIQNTIMHYRKPVFNGLAKNYEVTVLHSGQVSVGPEDDYSEIITKTKRFGPFFLQNAVLSEIRGHHYDVVIVMFDIRWINNVLAVFLQKKPRFIYWGHRYSKNWFVNILREKLMKFSDGVVQYSDVETCRMIDSGVPSSKIFIAHNTIHIPNHSDGRNVLKDSFVFVGRAQKRKKVDLLLKAFSEIVDQISPEIKINIIGSGPENDFLKDLAKEYNIADRVMFHGKIVDDEKLKDFFQRAYAYVSPGPVGLGVLHSFAYGTPVVTSSYGKHGPEYNNLTTNHNALVYNTFDELKEALVRLCTDEPFARRLGSEAYAFYSQQRLIDNMLAGLKSAIENDTGGA